MVDAIQGDITEDTEAQDQFDEDAKMKSNSGKAHKAAIGEDEIVATAFVILVAGYDTTGSLLSYACYELSKNDEVQEKLRQEVEEIMDGDDKVLKYEDVQKMTYMDQVLSETLRLHVPLAMLQRVASRDYTLPGTNIAIPKGAEAWINPVGIHSDMKHYPNPDVFDPDNFSAENTANRHP